MAPKEYVFIQILKPEKLKETPEAALKMIADRIGGQVVSGKDGAGVVASIANYVGAQSESIPTMVERGIISYEEIDTKRFKKLGGKDYTRQAAEWQEGVASGDPNIAAAEFEGKTRAGTQETMGNIRQFALLAKPIAYAAIFTGALAGILYMGSTLFRKAEGLGEKVKGRNAQMEEGGAGKGR